MKLHRELLRSITLRVSMPVVLITLGAGMISAALSIFIFTFFPVMKIELNYRISKNNYQPQEDLQPIDTDFGIVVPKIRANSAVVANVDYTQEKEYQWALTKGVAHAKGTALPGQTGNVFLFSHSTSNFYEAGRYNAIFYLLNKLEKNDEIDLYYKGGKFKYRVSDKKVVDPEDVQYLKGDFDRKTVTLMTCTPPGTTLKRLLVIGELER